MQPKVKTIVAIVSGVSGLLAIGFAMYNFVIDRPAISVAIENITLQSATNTSINEIATRLSTIEAEYGFVTAGTVIALREHALTLNDNSPIDDLKELVQETTNAISRFDDENIPEWTTNEIEYNDGVITYPDGTPFDLLENDYAEFVFAPDLYEAVLRDPSGIGPSTQELVKQQALTVYQIDEADIPERKLVASRLRVIREILRDKITNRGQRVVITTTIRNKSRAPNFIMSPSVLRIFNPDKSMFVDLVLVAEQNEKIDGYSIGVLTLESGSLDALTPTQKVHIVEGYKESFTCILMLSDIHGEVWHVVKEFSGLSFREVSGSLLDKLEEVYGDMPQEKPQPGEQVGESELTFVGG